MIPKIIHQIWHAGELPAQFHEAQKSWRSHHPDWTYMFWADAEMAALVRESYPQLLEHYLSYPDFIQRVDSARYMILHRYGDFYSAVDISCERSFEPL